MLLFSSDVLTWTLTGLVILLAYVLGAAHSRGAAGVPGAGEFSKPSAPRANAEPQEEERGGEDAESLATVRTKTLANQPSAGRVDGERAPQTPARILAPSLGNRKESEEHSDDGEVESRHEGKAPENVRVGAVESGDGMGADATAASAQLDRRAQAGDTKASFVRRKIVPMQHHEFAVVHFRDDGEVTVREKESSADKGARLNLKSWEVERKKQATASKGRKVELAGASTPDSDALPPSTTRVTSDGIPVVDVSRGSSVSSGSSGLVRSGGSRGLMEKTKESRLRKGPGNTSAMMKKAPSRTTSNSSERERVSVVYKSPSSPPSRKSPNYTPRGNDLLTASEVDGGGRASAGGRMGGDVGAASGPRHQGHQHSNVERQESGRWSNQLNGASPAYLGSAPEFFQGATGVTSQATDTSPISTISSISTGLSPSHRRNESENTKLEGAWMVASMAAAELGIGASDRPAGGQEDRITVSSNSDAVSPWEMSWANPMDRPDSVLGGSNSSNLGLTSLPSSTDRPNHDAANRGLDLYSSLSSFSSLSSLSWAHSNSLSSYGSSLHRTSTSDRPDVFNTIKSIWGERNEPEEEKHV